MGLLDHYRQFEAMSEAEVNEKLREQAAERKRKALATLEPLDLSRTTWPELPHPYVVNAVTYVARRGLHRYLDPGASELRGELAARHGVGAERIAVGNGAAQLLGAAAHELLEPQDELITPWPSYPLYPLIAHRARAAAVPVAGWGVEAILSAVNERSRAVALCNPNDPTGELLGVDDLDRLLSELPERVVVLLDEALRDFVDAEPIDAALDLLGRHPRLLVFRSFSKAWGLAGLRCGYAVGAEGSEPLLERLVPELGVNELAQAGALEALRAERDLVTRRRASVAGARERVAAAARELGYDAPASHANFVWLALPGLDGAELASRLGRHGVIVAPGGPLGDSERVRASTPDDASATRLLRALENAKG